MSYAFNEPYDLARRAAEALSRKHYDGVRIRCWDRVERDAVAGWLDRLLPQWSGRVQITWMEFTRPAPCPSHLPTTEVP